MWRFRTPQAARTALSLRGTGHALATLAMRPIRTGVRFGGAGHRLQERPRQRKAYFENAGRNAVESPKQESQRLPGGRCMLLRQIVARRAWPPARVAVSDDD